MRRTSAFSPSSTPDSGTLDWGYAYKTDAASSGYRFFYYMPQEPQATGEKPLESGETLLIKGAQSERLAAVEPNQMKVLWDRPITKASRLLGVDSRMLYMGGNELSAIDLKTRKLVWATRLPGGSMSGRVLVGPAGLWQLTSRGIYELDLQTGNVRRIFRGNDLGSAGGDLVLTDRWLLTVSNRTVSAYPRRGQTTAAFHARRRIRHFQARSRLAMSKPAILAIAFTLAAGCAASPARAQFFDGSMGGNVAAPAANIEGFTVVGRGQLSAKPDLVEVDLDVTASSELTADAIVKYRDAKRRIHDAFAALKLKNLTIEERGLLVDQKGQMQSPYFFDFQPNNRAKTEVQLSRKLVVKASDLRKMDEEGVLQLVGRLLDVAQDAGAKVGPPNMNPYYYYRFGGSPTTGLARFVVEDFDKLQEEAYEKAIADARSRAERLARLSKVELGPIVAVREVMVSGDRVGGDDEPVRKRLETSKFHDIPIRVELLVRFQVLAKPVAKGTNP